GTTYTGTTTINSGTLALAPSGALNTSSSLVVAGGTFNLGSNDQSLDTVTLSSGSISGSGSLTGTSYSVQSGSISAILAGGGALTKTTASTATHSAANFYSGSTTLSIGTLARGAGGSITAASIMNVSGGKLNSSANPT